MTDFDRLFSGAKIFEGVTVEDVLEDVFLGNRRVGGIKTAEGQVVHADYVVNCAGMWARQLGEFTI